MISISRTGLAGSPGMEVDPTWVMDWYGVEERIVSRSPFCISKRFAHDGSEGKIVTFMFMKEKSVA
jgi:hypothetical protein